MLEFFDRSLRRVPRLTLGNVAGLVGFFRFMIVVRNTAICPGRIRMVRR